MSNTIKKPTMPDFDKDEFTKFPTVAILYIIELLEAIAISQGIELIDPD